MIALIIPSFFLFLAIEYWVGKKENFSYENSVANISIGIAERLLSLFITGGFYTLYYYVYEHYAFISIPNHWVVWVLLLLATDFVWYWYHRLGHEINIFWGAHIVHHHSEDFNYTVSARITTLQALVRNLFWCTLPLAGFHPAMVITILIIHGTYSFFTHTQIVGKLGWLEHILITPSHHGVHHASNPRYLNKNYGDIFVFWDKIFGTFQAEEEKPVYGLTHPLKSRSFLWQHFHYYAEMWEACRRGGNFIASLKVIFGRPEDLDQSIRPELEKRLLPTKGQPRRTFRLRAYINVQIAAALGGLALVAVLYEGLDSVRMFLASALIIITLINCGALMEQQRWIYFLEGIRCIMLCGWIGYESGSIAFFLIGIGAVLFFGTMEKVESWYFEFVYSRDVFNDQT